MSPLASIEKPAVGIVANPASGRDVRRLVAKASVFHTAEKCNIVQRALTALASCGVRSAVMMPDLGGIAAGVMRAMQAQHVHASAPWPNVTFLDLPIEDSALDSVRAVERMLELGVALIVVLGGDGTHRVVASRCGNVPLVALSTGTNNAFPEIREATIAGLAAGLIASGAVPGELGTIRNKVLRVRMNGEQRDLALVDVCVSHRSLDWRQGPVETGGPDRTVRHHRQSRCDRFVGDRRTHQPGRALCAARRAAEALPRGSRHHDRARSDRAWPDRAGGNRRDQPDASRVRHTRCRHRAVCSPSTANEKSSLAPMTVLSVSLELDGPLTVDIGRVMSSRWSKDCL